MSAYEGIEGWEDRTQRILDWINQRNSILGIQSDLPIVFSNSHREGRSTSPEPDFEPGFEPGPEPEFEQETDNLKNPSGSKKSRATTNPRGLNSTINRKIKNNSRSLLTSSGKQSVRSAKFVKPVPKMSFADSYRMGPTAAENSGELSGTEIKLASSLFKHMIGRPNVNWAHVAVDMGFKDANIAKVRFGQIRKKHGWNNNDELTSAAPVGNGPTVGGTFAADDSMVDEEGVPTFSTPTAKDMSATPNGSGVKGAKVKKPRARKDPNTPTKPRKGSKAWLAAQAAALSTDADAEVQTKEELKEECDAEMDDVPEDKKAQDFNDEA